MLIPGLSRVNVPLLCIRSEWWWWNTVVAKIISIFHKGLKLCTITTFATKVNCVSVWVGVCNVTLLCPQNLYTNQQQLQVFRVASRQTSGITHTHTRFVKMRTASNRGRGVSILQMEDSLMFHQWTDIGGGGGTGSKQLQLHLSLKTADCWWWACSCPRDGARFCRNRNSGTINVVAPVPLKIHTTAGMCSKILLFVDESASMQRQNIIDSCSFLCNILPLHNYNHHCFRTANIKGPAFFYCVRISCLSVLPPIFRWPALTLH